MLKKVVFLLALVMLVNTTNVFAQDENTDVTGLKISGEVRARGWIGAEENGANLSGSDTKIVFQYKFSNYSGAELGFNANNLKLGVSNAFVYSDILREFGVQAVGLKLQLGKFGLKNSYYHPSIFQAGDDSVVIDDDFMTDRLQAMVELNVSRDIVPLLVRIGGDLDFGYKNQQPNDSLTIKSGGYNVMAEIALDKMTIADAITLGVGVYTSFSNGEFNDSNAGFGFHSDGKLVANKPLMQIGGSLGVSVLNLPINLDIGASFNYYDFQMDMGKEVVGLKLDKDKGTGMTMPGDYIYGSSFKTGFGATVGAMVSMDNKFEVGVGYRHQDAPKWDFAVGHSKAKQDTIGIQAKLTMLEKFQPYVGFGFMVASSQTDVVKKQRGFAQYGKDVAKAMADGKDPTKVKYADGKIGFDEIHQVEVGVDYIPVKNTVISLGWTRKGRFIQDNGTIRAMTAQAGWGAIYLRGAFKF